MKLHHLPALALLLLAASCTDPKGKDSTDDTAGEETGTDSGHETDEETGEDTAGPCVDEPYFCGADWYRAFGTPRDQGLEWEVDEEFSIPGATVPNVLTLHDGAGYVLIYTDARWWGSRWASWSEDGLSWVSDEAPLIQQGFFGDECVEWLGDTAEMYLDDGSYRLMVEGYEPETRRFTHCTAISTDARTWTPEKGNVYEIPESDAGGASVWSVLRTKPSGDWYGWYNGDLWGTSTVRVAKSADGRIFEPHIKEPVLPYNFADPDVIRLDEGGLRAYIVNGREGRLEWADGADEGTFTRPEPLRGSINDSVCDPTGEVLPSVCRVDPSFVRLADGSLWLYFGEFVLDEERQISASLRRARAVDGP